MANRPINRPQQQRNIQQQMQRPQGGGGGGGAVQERPQQQTKDIRELGRELDEVSNANITFAPETNADIRSYAARLERLDNEFHMFRSRTRQGKRISLDVIDDGRITPSERLSLFVKASVEEGYDKIQAIEFALERLEQRGENLAGRGRQRSGAKVNWNALLEER